VFKYFQWNYVFSTPYNVYYFVKLLNRLEIKLKNLDKTLYEDEYKEIFGSKCYSTL